ncbi:MAG: hypothetical protein KC470_10085, partial [Dehalococcoidia bacterium]|nr:hypothetical protein [Dehalococcoidia bacterium]
ARRPLAPVTHSLLPMEAFTRKLWAKQDQHPGDRWRLFRAVAAAFPATRVLYPGSYVDLAPSFVFPDVTYVDVDRRAARFFTDEAGVREMIASHDGPPSPRFRFVDADYTAELALAEASFDLLISLFAGPVSEHCARYLRPGGWLLANTSHGDVSLAAIDPRYRIVAVIVAEGDEYAAVWDDVEAYLAPRSSLRYSREEILRLGRGVPYRRSAHAYLFRRELL